VRASIDLFRFPLGCLTIGRHTVEQRHLLQTARTLEYLRVNRVGGRGLAPTAVAARLVELLHLRLDLALQLLESRLQLRRIHRRAVILGDEGRGGAAVDGDGFAPLHQRGQRGAA